MKEYIEREAALGEFDKVCDICMALVENPMCGDCSIADTVRKVKHIPAADVVEVRHGRWEERIVDDDELDKYGFFRRRFYCSACGDWNTHGASKYCPHCGAKMDGGVNDATD